MRRVHIVQTHPNNWFLFLLLNAFLYMLRQDRVCSCSAAFISIMRARSSLNTYINCDVVNHNNNNNGETSTELSQNISTGPSYAYNIHSVRTIRDAKNYHTNRSNADWHWKLHILHNRIKCISKLTALRIFCCGLSHCHFLSHRHPPLFLFFRLWFIRFCSWINFDVQWIAHLVCALWIME